MRVQAIIKRCLENYNPLVKWHRTALRKRINNYTVTFLTPNCIGGLLFHDLGLQFMSPTVNLMFYQDEFIRFVTNLDYYLSKDFEFYDNPDCNCPCAMLGDVRIIFTHYKTANEAALKWKARAERINADNIFVFAEERDGVQKEDIIELGKLKVRGLVVFTANEYPDIPYTVQIPKYKNKGCVGNILRKNYLTGRREYEKYFDFVKWFNEASGESHDVSSFVK